MHRGINMRSQDYSMHPLTIDYHERRFGLAGIRAMLHRISHRLPYSNHVLTRRMTISRPIPGRPKEYEEVVLEVPEGDFGLRLTRQSGTVLTVLQEIHTYQSHLR